MGDACLRSGIICIASREEIGGLSYFDIRWLREPVKKLPLPAPRDNALALARSSQHSTRSYTRLAPAARYAVPVPVLLLSYTQLLLLDVGDARP